MNAPARIIPTDEPSALDRIAFLAVQMVLVAARSQAPALLALIRVASEEHAKLEGDQQSAMYLARRCRIHEERHQKIIRGRR